MPSLIQINNNDINTNTSELTACSSQIINNNPCYTLDASFRPHLLSSSSPIINNSQSLSSTNISNNNNNNCIDLDLYDYLLKKSKSTTFALWNIASNNQKYLNSSMKKSEHCSSFDKVNEILQFENNNDGIFKCLNKNLIDSLFKNDQKKDNLNEESNDLEIIRNILDDLICQMEKNELNKNENFDLGVDNLPKVNKKEEDLLVFMSVNSDDMMQSNSTTLIQPQSNNQSLELNKIKPSLDEWLTAHEDLSLTSSQSSSTSPSSMSSYQPNNLSSDESSSLVEIIDGNVKKITLKSKEIVFIEDCMSDDDENHVESGDIDLNLFKDFSFRDPVIYKNNGKKANSKYEQNVFTKSTSNMNNDDQDACIKEALKRFDAFCKSKYQSTVPTNNMTSPTTNITETSSSNKNQQHKSGDYSSFIKRRQARIQSLFNNNNNDNKKTDQLEVPSPSNRSKSPLDRQNLEPENIQQASLNARKFLDNLNIKNENDVSEVSVIEKPIEKETSVEENNQISDETDNKEQVVDCNLQEQQKNKNEVLLDNQIKNDVKEELNEECVSNVANEDKIEIPKLDVKSLRESIEEIEMIHEPSNEIENKESPKRYFDDISPRYKSDKYVSIHEPIQLAKQDLAKKTFDSYPLNYKNDKMIKDRDSYVMNYINSLNNKTSESNGTTTSTSKVSCKQNGYHQDDTKPNAVKSTNKELVDFLNAKEKASTVSTKSSTESPIINGNKHVNIIKLEVINSSRGTNSLATRSVSESRMRLGSNDANKSDRSKDSLRGSQDSETSISSGSWRQKLKQMYNDESLQEYRDSRKSSIDKNSSNLSEEKSYSQQEKEQTKVITPRSTTSSHHTYASANSKPESRIIPIELKRKSSNETEKIQNTITNTHVETSQVEETKVPVSNEFSRGRVFDSEYRESSLPPRRSPRSEGHDPVAEKACNNFMFKLMEFKRQQQYNQPLSTTYTTNPYGKTLYSESSYKPQIDYEPYMSSQNTGYSRSISEPESDTYITSRSRENSVPDDTFYSPSDYNNYDTTSYGTSSDRPYVSSIRKRRTLFSDQNSERASYNRPVYANNDYTSYNGLRTLDRNYTPSYMSPSYSSYTSNYNPMNTNTSTFADSTTSPVSSSTEGATTASQFAYSHALNRPLSIVNEEDRNSIRFSLDKMQTIDEKLKVSETTKTNGSMNSPLNNRQQLSTTSTTSVLKTRPSQTSQSSSTNVPKKPSQNQTKSPYVNKATTSSINNNGLISGTNSQSSITSTGVLNSTSVAHQASVFDRLASTLDRKKTKSRLNFSSNNSFQSSTNCSETESVKNENDNASVSSLYMSQKQPSKYSMKPTSTSTQQQTQESSNLKVSNSTFRIRSLESNARDKLKKEVPKSKQILNSNSQQQQPKSTNPIEIPVKVEHVIPITIESKTKTDSPQLTTRKKSTSQSTYAFGSSIPKSSAVQSTDEMFDRLNKKTTSMKNLSNILKRTMSHEPAAKAKNSNFNSSSTDLFNLGLSVAPQQIGEIDVDSELDTETCVNTKMNQRLSKNGSNVFERLYKGNQMQQSNTNLVNSLLFPQNGDKNHETSNSNRQPLRKNMSLSTASLSSSTSGSNIVNSSQPTAIKKLNNEQRTFSKTSLNKKSSINNGLEQTTTNTYDRLSLSKATGKTALREGQKSNLDLTNSATQSASSLPKSSSPESFVDDDLSSTNSIQTGSSAAIRKTNFTNRIKGLFKKNVN